jgi:hypothetical protein
MINITVYELLKNLRRLSVLSVDENGTVRAHREWKDTTAYDPQDITKLMPFEVACSYAAAKTVLEMFETADMGNDIRTAFDEMIEDDMPETYIAFTLFRHHYNFALQHLLLECQNNETLFDEMISIYHKHIETGPMRVKQLARALKINEMLDVADLVVRLREDEIFTPKTRAKKRKRGTAE